MAICKLQQFSPLLPFLVFFLLHLLQHSNAQPSPILPNTTGYDCTANQTASRCQAYAYYRASSPDFLDLASIADLFAVSRLMVSEPSNISSPSSPLISGQSLFIPLTCSCNSIDSTFGAISYANISYKLKPNDSYYLVSTTKFQNLTAYQSVEVVNPTLVPANLDIGVDVIFPVFCWCPNRTQLQNQENYMISYVYQPSDNFSSVASRFNSTVQSIIGVNGNNIQPFETLFIPVNKLPVLSQPTVVASPPPAVSVPVESPDRTGSVRGLAIGLGITGLLSILILGLWVYREVLFKQRRWVMGDEEKHLVKNVPESNLRNFTFQELAEATNYFNEELGRGSCGIVYKGAIETTVIAVKKLDQVLQGSDKEFKTEVNVIGQTHHKNLVRLRGYCDEGQHRILVYEFMSNGTLASLLFGDLKPKWKQRVHFAFGIARGLLYLHEECFTQIIHCDIKPQNILLDEYYNARISDFGLSKLLFIDQSGTETGIRGTKGYVAPEWFRTAPINVKVDVYSFGVLLLEIICCRKNVDKGIENEEKAVLTDWAYDCYKAGRLNILVENDDEAISDMSRVEKFVKIAIWCLQEDPSVRPKIKEVLLMMEGIVPVKMPPSPYLFSFVNYSARS